MAMRLPFNPAVKKIEAFIGAWGVKTSEIPDADHLLELASRLFEVDNSGIPERMADEINALGKKERKRLAHKNINAVFGYNPRETSASSEGGTITEAGLQRMMDASKPQMIDGEPFDCIGELDIDPAQLLRKVVSAVISADRPDILWEFPDVLAFFGSRIPQREEVAHLHAIDERMFDTADKWPNRKHPDV